MNIWERAGYLALCATTIGLFVFLNATQPFVLTSIFKDVKSGSIVSHLALADELINIVCAPLWGSLSDKIGTRYVAVVGTAVIGTSLVFYPEASSIYPQLILLRILFAVGGSANVSMITAILSEYSRSKRGGSYLNDDTQISAGTAYGRTGEASLLAAELDADFSVIDDGDQAVASLFSSNRGEQRKGRGNGTMAGLVGLFSGLGAIFAVAVLLPLPTQLGYESSPTLAIKEAYAIVGFASIVLAVGFFFTLHQDRSKGLSRWFRGQGLSIFDEAALDYDSFSQQSYWFLVKKGFEAAKEDRGLQLAYYGSAVARSISVVIALFVPLWVNNWYYQSGQCSVDDSKGCRQGYIQAAILTGIANTASLLGAPLIGWVVDKIRPSRVMAVSGIIGIVTMLAFLFTSGPEGWFPIVISILTGLSSIGVMTESLAMCADGRREFSGSIAGVYSLCGGFGILLLTQIGGPLADTWIKAPFAVMALLFAGLQAGWLY